MNTRALAVVALLTGISCTRPNPAVCCVTATDCAKFDEPANSRPCTDDYVCSDFSCVPEGQEQVDASLADAVEDSAVADTAAPRCNPSSPFGAASLVPNVNSSLEERYVWLDPAETTMHLLRSDGGSVLTPVTAMRADKASDFTAPTATATFAPIFSASGTEHMPWISGDGLSAYFHRQEAGTPGIFVSSRGTTSEPFTSGSSVTVAGAALTDALFPTVSRDGQRLYWLDYYTFRLSVADRIGGPAQFGGRVYVTSSGILGPVLASDELRLFYAVTEDAGADVLVATRAAVGQAFGSPTLVQNVNSTAQDTPLFISDDDCELYIASRRPGGVGGLDVFRAKKTP